MIIQHIKFKSQLSKEEFEQVAKDRKPAFELLPGLIQKHFVSDVEGDYFGGIYIWESSEAMHPYRSSDLAASIPEAYKVIGNPKIETMNILLRLK